MRAVVAASVAIALVLLATACGSASRATAGLFTGYWWGHTRGLAIMRSGHGREIVDDGCCSRVITMNFRVLRVDGTRSKASAEIRVTFARIDKGVFLALHRRTPHSGQVGTLRLRRGVITDDLTGATFCAPDVDKCGA
jgi:hypothetical protein